MSSATGWTPEGYTRFALSQQWESMWTLACWIAARCDAEGWRTGEVADFGAGPGLLSHFLARRVAARCVAIPQPAFEGLARVTLAELASSAEVGQEGSGAGRFDLVVSYGCLHEAVDSGEFLNRAARLARPGGAVLVLDTVAEAASVVAARASGVDDIDGAIRQTFADSLTRDEFERIARERAGETGPVLYEGGVLADAFLSLPEAPVPDRGGQPEAEEIVPTLQYVTWRKALA